VTQIQITIDTNLLDPDKLEALRQAAHDLEVDMKSVTVSVRERGSDVLPEPITEPAVWGESRWDSAKWTTSETLVLDESTVDTGVLASLEGQTRFEAILAIISNGSFPPPSDRESLFPGQRRQLRDAMILEAHARDGRHVFISHDAKGFIDGGRREQLEALCATRILRSDEFAAYCDELRSLPPGGHDASAGHVPDRS
jgi:hypothetical protein